MAKISQTQRNHMITRVKRAIQNKQITVKTEDYDPLDVINTISSSVGYYRKTDEEFKEALVEKASFISKHKSKIPGILEKKKDLEKIAFEHNTALDKLELELIDKLMLGNDLADLQNALKEIEGA